MFGLPDTDITEICAILRRYAAVEQALIFGSRAKGGYKNGSDVDIALKGTGLDYRAVFDISGSLNEDTIMPYHFDVLHYETVSNPDLVSHIDQVGKVLYQRE
jgi:uncharacterized protein